MPTINIPAKVRFCLYLLSSVLLLTVAYTNAKGWTGDAENTLVLGVAALISTLAAAKTDTSTATGTPTVKVKIDSAQVQKAVSAARDELAEPDVDPAGEQDPDNPRAG